MDAAFDEISVTYKFIDGAHFFVPADKKAMGLCVANTNLEIAYKEVGEQLSKIVAFSSGKMDVEYLPSVPFDEFKQLIIAYGEVTEKLVGDKHITANPTQAWTQATAAA